MKRSLILASIFLLSTGGFAQTKAANKPKSVPVLKSSSDSLSYAIGQDLARNLREFLIHSEVLQDENSANFNEKLNQEALESFISGAEKGIKASSAKEKAYGAGFSIGLQLVNMKKEFEANVLSGEKIDNEIFIQSIASFLKQEESIISNPGEYITMKKNEKDKAEEKKHKEIEEKFLAENKLKEGVRSLPSGLQYKIIKEGTGRRPLPDDKVTVHYEGRLLDGTVFDSSYKRGQPASFKVTQVIKGWTEALQIMPVGSKWTIYIPYELGYGSSGTGNISPYSTLIFDIELMKIVQ